MSFTKKGNEMKTLIWRRKRLFRPPRGLDETRRKSRSATGSGRKEVELADNLIHLALHGKTEQIRLAATERCIDRGWGRPASPAGEQISRE
jgi:hypothetical protein